MSNKTAAEAWNGVHESMTTINITWIITIKHITWITQSYENSWCQGGSIILHLLNDKCKYSGTVSV